MKYRYLFFALCLLFSLPAWACELRQEYQLKTVPGTIETLRRKLQPDKRLSVFRVSVAGEHSDGKVILTGEMSSREAHETLLTELAREFPAMGFTDRITVLPHPDLAGEQAGLVRISVASQYRDPKYGSELINQALMGTEVRVLKKTEGWYYVQLPDGYLGWMSGSYLVRGDTAFLKSWQNKPKVLVRRLVDMVRQEPAVTAPVCSDVVKGARLVKVSDKGGWTAVELPDGRRGFIETAALMDESELAHFKPAAQDLENTAKEMLGFPYLWGGTSVKGMDCSGFTVSIYRFNNMLLPRDADMQSNSGQPVELDPDFSRLKKGDLLFFGPSPDRITHVGMYLGEGRFIHSSGLVHISSLRKGDADFDADLLEKLRKARRIL